MKPFRQHAEHADGVSFARSPRDVPCKQRTPPVIRVHQLPRRGTCFLPQSRMTYVIRGYNSHPVKGNPPSSYPSPSLETDVDTPYSQVPSLSSTAQCSGAYTTVHPTLSLANKVNDCRQSLTPYHSLLSTSGTFNFLSKVLFNFRSLYFFAIGVVVILSFRRELPPTLVCSPKHTDS